MNVLKKIIIDTAVSTALIANGAIAFAQIGDVADTVYTTDILTFVDNKPIKGFAISGKTMIALEDLRNFGFSVSYDDNIRTLFVTKTHKATESMNVSVEREDVGNIVGYVYETDIEAIVNGVKVDAYAIDGKMAAAVEDLGVYADVAITAESTGVFERKMTYRYNNDERNLYLYTDGNEYLENHSYEDMVDEYNSGAGNILVSNDYAIHFWSLANRFEPNSGSFYAYISYKDGADEVNLTEILRRYSIDTNNMTISYTDMEINYPTFIKTDDPERIVFRLSLNDECLFDPFMMRIFR